TWVSNDHSTRNQIDHLIIDARDGSNVLDVRSLRGADGDTDHNLVKAKIRFRISSEKPKANEALVQWNIDKMQNEEVRENYKQEIKQHLNTGDQSNDVEKLWQQMEKLITELAELIIGKRRKRTRKWFDRECQKKLHDR
ncbi:uncharacterized protein, partial [Diabrotica undecimpunctata]|uniref:uncharacterized protein n=1 Tax=Diabrotica undecimpunctata TaxID=50387 RepID=UPI003B63DFD2